MRSQSPIREEGLVCRCLVCRARSRQIREVFQNAAVFGSDAAPSLRTKVVVEDTADIIFLASEDLDEMLEEDPQIGNRILENLIKLLYARIYDVNQDVEELRGQVGQLRKRVEDLSPGDSLLQQLFPELSG